MKRKIEKCISFLSNINSLPPLIARLSVGVVFAESGWGKLHNLEQVTEYFANLGIPFATLQAPFVAGLEFVGGLLLIFGLASRLISIPLIAVMTVAIITAKSSEISSATDILVLSEYLYAVLLSWIFISGPGSISLDRIIFRKTKEVL